MFTPRHILILSIPVLAAAILFGCGGQVSTANLSASELYEQGMNEYQNEKYLKAIEYFQAIVYNYPGESVVDTAQFYLAMSYFGNEEYKLASVEFNRLMQNYPASVYAVNAQFMKAVCLYEAAPDHYLLDQTDLQEALTQLEDFVIDNPESELVSDAQQYILEGRTKLAHKAYHSAVVYTRIRAFEAAKIYFQRVIDDYTDTEYAPLATYGMANIAFERKNYDEAEDLFVKFTQAFPEHEMVSEARKKAAEAAFKAARKEYDNGDSNAARDKLQAFVTNFPSSEKVDDARELLAQLPEAPASDTTAMSDGGN